MAIRIIEVDRRSRHPAKYARLIGNLLEKVSQLNSIRFELVDCAIEILQTQTKCNMLQSHNVARSVDDPGRRFPQAQHRTPVFSHPVECCASLGFNSAQ